MTRFSTPSSATSSSLFRPFSRGFAARARAVGIDLGTSNSCVAVKEGDAIKVIENDEGSRTTPSVVGFHKGELVVGQQAKNQLVTEPENTFYAVKRLIGRRWDDPVIKKDISHVGYKIVEGKNGDAWVATKDGKKYSPSQIGAYVLQNLKKSAESYLNHEVKDAVVTVPAYFNNEQRQATKDAGAIAGLNVLRVINEPTAAAIAYGIKAEGDKTLAVFDLGGGTFDISILEVADDVFEVRSTNGDTFLGGEDFDKAILDHWCAKFQKEHKIDLKKDLIALQRLREAAENVKRSLDKKAKAEVALPWITQGSSGPIHFNAELTRHELEKLVMPIIEKTKQPCLTALKDAKKSPSEIHEVLLVGGMTRMPKVQEFVEEIFGKKPNKGINPDEAVAHGAAIQAAIASGDKFDNRDMVVLDIVPLSLGIETLGGVNTTLIPKGTVLPTRKSQVFSTAQDNQHQVEVHVLQGERAMAANCHTLGRFNLKDIPPAPKGTPQIDVEFDIDQNSIVHVKATDKGTGKAAQIEVKVKGGLSDEEIEKMKQEAEAHADADKAKREAIEARHEAQTLADSTRKQLGEHKDKLDAETISQIENDLESLTKLLEDESADPEQIKASLDDLQKSAMKMGEAIYKSKSAESSSSSDSTDQTQTTAEATTDETDSNKSK